MILGTPALQYSSWQASIRSTCRSFWGHASINITLDTYSHVIEGMDGGLGEEMDEAL